MKTFNEFSKKKCLHTYISCIKTKVAIKFLYNFFFFFFFFGGGGRVKIGLGAETVKKIQKEQPPGTSPEGVEVLHLSLLSSRRQLDTRLVLSLREGGQ